jgi:hypothetical protein
MENINSVEDLFRYGLDCSPSTQDSQELLDGRRQHRCIVSPLMYLSTFPILLAPSAFTFVLYYPRTYIHHISPSLSLFPRAGLGDSSRFTSTRLQRSAGPAYWLFASALAGHSSVAGTSGRP